MTSSSTVVDSGPRVRPVTWVILAWMLIMIAAIVGAWQGSASRYGTVPEITVASQNSTVDVLPFSATDLDGTTYTNPVADFRITGEEIVHLRLPTELRTSTIELLEVRADGDVERTIEAGDAPHSMVIPVETDEHGALEALVLRSVPVVFDDDGTESILTGEWSVGFTYED